MLPFLLGKAGKYLPVLPAGGVLLVGGKALHFPPITAAQYHFGGLLRRWRRGVGHLLAGEQCVNTLETGGVGLLLLKKAAQ